MIACKLGWDTLIEEGYLAVDEHGDVVVSPLAPTNGAVAAYLARLSGRSTLAFTPDREAYYQWHRDHTFKRTEV